MKKIPARILLLLACVAVFAILLPKSIHAAKHVKLEDFTGNPPFHIYHHSSTGPTGLSPAQIQKVYNLPGTGGSGTIAIVDAYDNPNAQNDLNTFSRQFGLPLCNNTNPCFEKHQMASLLKRNSGWILEEDLDVEWAHAIAPKARILLVEAKSNNGTDLLNAVNYARNRSDVVAISLSWGGSEFLTETNYDSYFVSPSGAPFFASSGDNGTGAEWPAVSPNVIAVGGTTLSFNLDGTLATESAWSGSGGGASLYEPMPSFQTTYGVSTSGRMRAIPDVSYDADPSSGVSVYDSYGYSGQSGWFTVGGTSAGAPQWAGIAALTHGISNQKLYSDALSQAATLSATLYFRDITSGTNGTCGILCTAITGYDFVTGLGSPLSQSF